MTENIVELSTRNPVTAPNEPVPEVVEVLESLLERARAGDIRAIRYGIVVSGSFASAWTTEGTENCKDKLLSAVALLSHRMLAALDERGSV